MNYPRTDNQINLCLTTCSQEAQQSVPGHSTDRIEGQNHGGVGSSGTDSGPHPHTASSLGHTGAGGIPVTTPNTSSSKAVSQPASRQWERKPSSETGDAAPPTHSLSAGPTPRAAAWLLPPFPTEHHLKLGTRWPPLYFFFLSSSFFLSYFTATLKPP